MWNVEEKGKRLKLNRVLEILENFVDHLEDKHEFCSFKDWEVDIDTTADSLKINMNSGHFGEETMWKEHKAYLRRAFNKTKKEQKEHDF